jgi:hypothetical protein
MCACSSPDPDDLIFPRATTRVGTKYQAPIPPKDGPRDPGACLPWPFIPFRFWRSIHSAILDIQERGGEATVEVLSLIHETSDTKGEHAAPLSSPGAHGPFSTKQPPSVSYCYGLCRQHTFILRHVVEQRKTRLTNKQSLRSNVDWLTEVIRRFSEAYTLGADLSTVSMSNVFRFEKVCKFLCMFSHVVFTHFNTS